jgi:hypothetical protein
VVNEVQNPYIKHVKAITTLRNGKVIEKDIPRKIKKLRMMMGLMIRKIKKRRKKSTNLLPLFLKQSSCR